MKSKKKYAESHQYQKLTPMLMFFRRPFNYYGHPSFCTLHHKIIDSQNTYQKIILLTSCPNQKHNLFNKDKGNGTKVANPFMHRCMHTHTFTNKDIHMGEEREYQGDRTL